MSRIEKDGTVTVLADNFEGKRLNSPNDLVYRSDGTLYFTDPPFGLPKFFDDPRKELPFSGVFSLQTGELRLVDKRSHRPQRHRVLARREVSVRRQLGRQAKVVMRYAVRPTAVVQGQVFFDMTSAPGEDAIDGIKVDKEGNLYVSGPGGLWIISAAGKHLGTIIAPRHPHNFAWGDEDGRTLYLCARRGLYRMRLGIAGVRPRVPIGRVVRKDPRLDALLPAGGTLERIAEGIEWAEGPVWDRSQRALLVSDVCVRTRFSAGSRARGTHAVTSSRVATRARRQTRRRARLQRPDSSPGPAHLLPARRPPRRAAREERQITTLPTFKGKRLNSPNDLVIHSNGDLYFTDPPYGLPELDDPPGTRLPRRVPA